MYACVLLPQNEKKEEKILHKGKKVEGVTQSGQRAEEGLVGL